MEELCGMAVERRPKALPVEDTGGRPGDRSPSLLNHFDFFCVLFFFIFTFRARTGTFSREFPRSLTRNVCVRNTSHTIGRWATDKSK